ncbi:glucose-6-phosphate isomerase [Primorskyibacter aestuariivivens]|uniref:glycine zipper 2TM domain-containing protein n=1 Tax=Primorskyibacter aestuariivivens TaxID=1888912 RepID=UPI002300DD22|nr:glycine zipper 2TM domain-containing protein [Primorskyibacter aestuariivivens]MDA7430318.1 glucose-6-phosphate isomerase [Primorskyibacter aestuariivivens]
MTFRFLIPAVLAGFTLSACDTLTTEQRTVAGVAGGAAAGLIAASVLKADNNWRIIAALAGAAAGTVVAQNTATGRCAYSNGDGTYYTAPCR